MTELQTGHPRTASGGARVRRRLPASEPSLYDFRRPIQLSREHARVLQLAFDGYARAAQTVFTTGLRTVCQVTLASIEQRSYAEYVDSLDGSTYMTIFTADQLGGAGVLELPLPATMACVDHLLGGPGGPNQPMRPLTEIESNVIKGFIDRLLGEIRTALLSVVRVDPVVSGIEYSPLFAQVAGPADVMVVVTWDVHIGLLTHRMTLCLPFADLLPHLVGAVARAAVSDREHVQRELAAEQLTAQFQHVPVEVTVRLRHTKLSPADLSGLRVGDIVRLSHPAAAPLDVTVADKTFAHATAGTHGQHLAALVVAVP